MSTPKKHTPPKFNHSKKTTAKNKATLKAAPKHKVKFIKSGFKPDDYPVHKKKEVAFLGRSNAGKSSLINALAKDNVAMVSQTPGKTRLINFFAFGESYVLVDMPGYGFASRSGSEIEEWQKAIETYLEDRECLAGLVLVMDVRREWEDEEKMLLRYSNKIGLPLVVAMTKIDRLTQKELNERIKAIKAHAHTSLLFPISSTKENGIAEVENFIYNEWIKAK